jgi:hypothetical protein
MRILNMYLTDMKLKGYFSITDMRQLFKSLTGKDKVSPALQRLHLKDYIKMSPNELRLISDELNRLQVTLSVRNNS